MVEGSSVKAEQEHQPSSVGVRLPAASSALRAPMGLPGAPSLWQQASKALSCSAASGKPGSFNLFNWIQFPAT